jgi:hypothetical protein
MKVAPIYLLLLFLLLSCNNKKNQTILPVEAEFVVDDSLLNGESFIDSTLNLSLRIPKNWISLNSDLLEIVNIAVLVDEYKTAELKGGFYNPKDTSFMIIIDLSNVNKLYLSDLHLNYKTLLNKNKTFDDIQFQEFNHKFFGIEQYVLQNENILSFKLICSNLRSREQKMNSFEVMYLINRNKVNENIKSIESSIGSLNCLTF